MPRFDVYKSPRTDTWSFDRHDGYVHMGTVVAPEGSALFEGVRSRVRLMSIPPTRGEAGDLRSYIGPHEAANEAPKGGFGLAWEPAPQEVPS